MKGFTSQRRSLRCSLPLFLVVVCGFLGVVVDAIHVAPAQAAPPITPAGLNTQVNLSATPPPGGVQYDITGGTRPGGGANLFHSFGEFGVPTNNIANFLNGISFDLAGNPLAPGLPTSNILGRVTGGNVSNIFGTIQTTGFGNANLFLMNPAGFLFGPNATVNVGGMVAFTSADYLKLADNARFNAIPDVAADALLTASPVAAFGFLGLNPAAITVQGSQFTVTEGTGISLVGGSIAIQSGTLEDATVQPARLSAPGGQINLASVASPGEVLSSNFASSANMTLGSITLSEGSVLDVSANAAGTVRIRSGSFVMDNAAISADTVNANGAPVAIDINVTDNVSISTIDVPALTARTTGTGNAGEIAISSGSIDVTATTVDSFSFSAIDTHTSSSGNAGSVDINTGDLAVAGDPFSGGTLFIESGTSGMNPGRGGDVTISAGSIELRDTMISTGNLSAFFLGEGGAGTAGNVTITADSLQLTLSQIVTDSFDFVEEIGRAGDITVTARDINLDNSGFSSAGQERGGAITINADHLFAVDSQIVAQTNLTHGGEVTVTGKVIELTTGSSIVSSTSGDGDAGSISITATDRLGLLLGTALDRPSGIFSNSDGFSGSLGNSGDIVIATPRLEMTGGARINTSTATSGRGGNVTINTTNSISMSGETGGQFPEPLFSLGTIQPSGIYTLTIGGNCTGPCGNAGNVSVTTGSLSMGAGSQINSGTRSSGQGGNITVVAGDTIAMAGTLSTGQPGGIHSGTIGTEPDSGSGGNIALAAGQSFTISNGASVSASSTGSGNAGNITIQGLASPAESVLIDGPGSGIFTNTQGTGAGGNIFVNANTVTLQNGGMLSAQTSGTEATATGGTITVHANQVQLNDQAKITASSTRLTDKPNTGAGNAGTITVTAEENIVLLGNSSITTTAGAEGNGGLVSLTAPSIELHGNSNIGTSTAGVGNAGNIELQGNQVNLLTDSFVTARTQAEGRGGNITIRGLTGEGSRATDVRLSGKSQVRSETHGDGENIQGAAGNILIETARLNLSGGSLLNTGSLGSTGAAGNITVNATDSLTISGVGTQLNSQSVDFSFGDAGHISISAPSVVIENSGHITTSTGLVGNAGIITVNTNDLQLLSGGHITSSSLAEVPELSSGAAGTVTIQGLASSAQSVFIDGPASGIFTDTRGSGLGGNITLNANTVALQNGGTLSAKTSGTAPSATGGTITIDAADTISMSNRASINASSRSPGGADAGSINITAMNGFTMQNSTITTEAGQEAGGGNIKVTTSPAATVLLQDSLISASVADGHGGGGNISIDPQFVILQNSQILAQAAQGQGGAITIIANLFLPDANSIVNADSGSGLHGTVTIQSPNAPASGKIQPLGKTPLQATSLLNQHCASLAGGEFSSFTVAGRDSLPTEPSSWLASPLATLSDGMGLGVKAEGVKSEGERPLVRGEGLEGETPWLSLRQIAPPGFLTQAFAVDWSAGCKS
jgi:filamentous hemagglutinin family protein